MSLELTDDKINIGSGNGLLPLAITWANVDPDLYQHMVSLDDNELTHGSWNKMGGVLHTLL